MKAYVLSDNMMQLHTTTHKKAIKAREREAIIFVLFIMICVAMVVFNTIFIGNLLNRKIAMLTAGLNNIGAGNLDQLIDVEGNDELSNLARASNEMADRLRQITYFHKIFAEGNR